jgi:hypothetical protein
MEKLLLENVNDGQKGMFGELKYKRDVFLMPTGLGGTNPSYFVIHYKPEAGAVSKLLDKQGNQLIVVPSGAKDAYEKYTTAENTNRTIKGRSALFPEDQSFPTFAKSPAAQTKDTTKYAIIATGTNDYKLPAGQAMDEAVGNNVSKMIDTANSRGQKAVIVLPNADDPRFNNVRESIQRAVKDIDPNNVIVVEGKYDSKDPLHLSSAGVKELTSKYAGANVYGDSNAVRVGTALGYQTKQMEGKQVLIDSKGYQKARVGMGTAGSFEMMRQHPVPLGSITNAPPVAEPKLEINLNDIAPLASVTAVLTGVKTASAIPEAQKKIYDTIGSKALEYNLGDRMSYILKAIGIESAFSPTAQSPYSSAFGLGQMLKSTADKYIKGDPKDPVNQIDAFMRFTQDNIKFFERTYDRKPSNGEVYLMQQQGAAGASALLNNPNGNAIDVISKFYPKKSIAVDAIFKNLPPSVKGQAGNITAGEFSAFWMNRFR